MYLIKFTNEKNGKFLLHNGKSFCGGTKKEAEIVCAERILCNISANFEVVEIKDYFALGKMIGFVPGHHFKILDFSNGLVFWKGVKIVCTE